MTADLFRGVEQDDIDDYPVSGSIQEKLDSRLVDSLRRYTAVSVFKVGGDITKLRIAAAIATMRSSARSMSYVLLDSGEHLIIRCEGTTPDDGVNAAHGDMPILDDAEIVELADIIVGKRVFEFTREEIVNAVRESVQKRYIDKECIRFKIEWD